MSSPAAVASTRPLNRSDAKTLVLAALGGALEFYDFIIYSFFAPVIAKLFFPAGTEQWLADLQTWGIFGAGYLARPLGGIVMAHFGDRVGRKRMFTLSVFMMAFPTLLMGLLPTYSSAGLLAPLALLLMRILQGAAIGGEIPGAWVFVSEHAPARRSGFAIGSLTAGLTGGILLGSLVAAAINRSYAPAQVADFAWRIPFVVGGAFGFMAVFLRLWLEETPVFEELRRRKALARELPLKLVLADHWRGVLLSMLITWVLTVAILVMIIITPSLLQKLYGFSAAEALTANSVATLCLTLGCLLAGALVDRFGPGPVLAAGSVALFSASYALYIEVAGNHDLLIPLYALTGLCVAIVAVIPSVIVRSFPAPVRFSGLSFSYNLAYAVSAFVSPLLVQLFAKANPLGPAHYMAVLCVAGLAAGLLVAKRGRDWGL